MENVPFIAFTKEHDNDELPHLMINCEIEKEFFFSPKTK
jgi:hypothetical protein